MDRPEISDADVGNEYESARRFYDAIKAFRSELMACANLSPIQYPTFIDMLAMLDDCEPDKAAWEEKVSDARRSY